MSEGAHFINLTLVIYLPHSEILDLRVQIITFMTEGIINQFRNRIKLLLVIFILSALSFFGDLERLGMS